MKLIRQSPPWLGVRYDESNKQKCLLKIRSPVLNKYGRRVVTSCYSCTFVSNESVNNIWSVK